MAPSSCIEPRSQRLCTAGEMWKAVDPEDKKRFEGMAARDKERAKTEMAAYKAKKEQAGSAAASPAAVDNDDAADMSD